MSLDFGGKKPGRGAYVCHDVECLKKARKSRALERAFSTAIPPEVYDAMEAELRGDTMNRNEQFLSLIGLCLRGRNLEVGEEPVEAVARARDARVLLLASDASDNTARRVRHFAEAGQCVWLRIPFTKQELGQATGRGSAAVVAITDIGLAVAVVRRLAEMDPEKYDEDLAKLELKAKRAAERKSEAAQHEKNLRRGIKRPKKQEVPDVKEVRPAGVSGKPSGEKQRRSAGVSDKRAEKAGPRRTAENGGAAKSFAKDDRTGRPFRKSGSRPSKSNRPKPKGRPNPYAHSRPVKKGQRLLPQEGKLIRCRCFHR